MSLKGSALIVLTNLPQTDVYDYQRLKEALNTRFGAELHRARLKARTQGQDEGLPELAEDIERQTRLAYPGSTAQPMIDLFAKDHFTDALPDEDMRLQVRRNRPASLRDVLHLALELELCDVASRSRRSVRGAHLDALEVRQMATKATDPALQQVLEILRELQINRWAGSHRRSRNALECWECHKKGLTRRRCPKLQQQSCTQNSATPMGNGR